MEKIGSGLYHLNLPMILIIQKHYCKFTGIGVRVGSNGNRTENRSTTKHTGIQKKNMWDVGERTATKQNYLPQVLSLMNLKFLTTELEKYGRYFLTIMMIRGKIPCDVFAGC
jgi:hypothetical protein